MPELRTLTGLFFAFLLSLMLTSCGPRQTSVPVDTAPQKTAEEIKQERRQQRLAQLEKKLNRARNNIRKAPDSFEQHLDHLSALKYEATNTRFEKDVEELIQGQKADFESFAMAQLEQLLPAVKSNLESGRREMGYRTRSSASS